MASYCHHLEHLCCRYIEIGCELFVSRSNVVFLLKRYEKPQNVNVILLTYLLKTVCFLFRFDFIF